MIITYSVPRLLLSSRSVCTTVSNKEDITRRYLRIYICVYRFDKMNNLFSKNTEGNENTFKIKGRKKESIDR